VCVCVYGIWYIVGTKKKKKNSKENDSTLK